MVGFSAFAEGGGFHILLQLHKYIYIHKSSFFKLYQVSKTVLKIGKNLVKIDVLECHLNVARQTHFKGNKSMFHGCWFHGVS